MWNPILFLPCHFYFQDFVLLGPSYTRIYLISMCPPKKTLLMSNIFWTNASNEFLDCLLVYFYKAACGAYTLLIWIISFSSANLIHKILFLTLLTLAILSFKFQPITSHTPFLVLFLLAYSSLYASTNFLVFFYPLHVVSWGQGRQAIYILLVRMTSTNSIIILIKVHMFQVGNVTPLVLVRTSFFVCLYSLRCKNLACLTL